MNRLLIGVLCLCLAPPAPAAETPDCVDCPDVSAVEIGTTYTGEYWRQASGGIATGTRYLDNLELTAALDGEQLFGLQGLQLFGVALYNNGHALTDELTGAAQGVSNIETVSATRLYELWSEWQFGARQYGPGRSGDQSIRFGLYDLNSEFDSIESAALFINPSHGIGPDFSQSGYNGPSIFPVTSLAVRAAKAIGRGSVQAAILDGVPGDPERPDRTAIRLSSKEGALLVGEMNYRTEAGLRVGGGYWRYTADFDDVSALNDVGEPQSRNDNAGAYLIVESPLLFAQMSDRGLKLFLRAGEAETRINPIGRYLGAGAVYDGLLFQGRDQFGVAIAIAELGDVFRSAQADAGFLTDARESNYELTYRFAITDWLTLQSDAQYVKNPGMDPTLRSGWALGMRFEVSQSWKR